jgi:transcriptional regulator with XRE-family HTH domain
MPNDQHHPISIGKKIERVRKFRGIKQEALADALKISRQSVSKLEQSDEIDDERLEQIAAALGVSANTIRNFNEEATFNYIQNNYEGSSSNYSGLYNCTFNPLEKLMEIVEENKALYQQLIQTEREKNKLLESLLNKK